MENEFVTKDPNEISFWRRAASTVDQYSTGTYLAMDFNVAASLDLPPQVKFWINQNTALTEESNHSYDG
ncbi:hypothetical protein V865_001819 [Kwoniella europaea PYCC6329]|uniref:Uncharacterized protein n=1 Tax=Kwoniella europaea PYCC6329 TaxID=1423913 RepID=A0AAX4KCT6_9TREE